MQDKDIDEKPPVFGSWKSSYLFVILFLIFQIILYYIITESLK